MLQRLEVKNFAIIDHIALSFQAGMTVFTGETGAGKSLLIDALALVLGDRASGDVVRSGTEKAEVTAVFQFENEKIRPILAKNRIEAEQDILVIKREITIQNKNTIKINNTPISLSELKSIARYLADIHSQFDTQRLIDKDNYLALLDGFRDDLIASYLMEYQTALATFNASLQQYLELQNSQKELADKNDLYRYQWNDLSSHELVAGEETELMDCVQLLANFDKIYQELHEIKHQLDEGGLLDGIYTVAEKMDRIAPMMPDFRDTAINIRDFYYELSETDRDISSKLRTLNFDPVELDQKQTRLDTLDSLKRKYKQSIDELIAYQERLVKLLDQSDHFTLYLAEQEKAVKAAHSVLCQKADDLSKLRLVIAKRITAELEREFKFLALPGTQFEIAFQPIHLTDPFDRTPFGPSGIDVIDFLITTNLGEPLKPLSKTVSGGEMSRIMLAFKTVFIQSQNLSTIIFDEIDSGISGLIASQIARKIKAISCGCQVISISHLPQVVAIADHHFKLSKSTQNNRTVSMVSSLSYDERVFEIAGMIAGINVSTAALENAKELMLEK